jgi:hypothetical protein
MYQRLITANLTVYEVIVIYDDIVILMGVVTYQILD